jgi:glycosyltransferase involved in cell wall biosynthesis
VIIPVYNAQATLEICLQALYFAASADIQVIVVDDASTDGSLEIAKKFPCTIIPLKENHGHGYARNQGIERARGEILVFVDADIVVKKGIFSLIEDTFRREPDTFALVGLLSKESRYHSFFTDYKNLYMFCRFSRLPQEVSFLFASLSAMRSGTALRFSQQRLKADDTEFGQRLAAEGHKIKLERNLIAEHLKKYNFFTFLGNDFAVAACWAGIFFRQAGFVQLWRQKRFAHASLAQIASIFLVVCLAIALLTGQGFAQRAVFFLCAAALIILCNLSFLLFLLREKGIVFFLFSLPVLILDYTVMTSGVVWGSIRFILLRMRGR